MSYDFARLVFESHAATFVDGRQNVVTEGAELRCGSGRRHPQDCGEVSNRLALSGGNCLSLIVNELELELDSIV